MALTEVLILLAGLVATIYVWCRYNYSYWKRKNIPYIEAVPLIGNISVMLTMKKNFGLHLSDIYNEKQLSDAPVVGLYILNKPALLVRDPELVKSVLIKDFNRFSNRYATCDPHGDALGSNNLFFVKNPLWKELRQKLSPVFSSGKIKQMYPLMTEIGLTLEKHLDSYIKTDNTFVTEMKEICALFTTDLIATVAFGVRVNSLANPKVEFRQEARKMFDFTLGRAKDFFVAFFLPNLVTAFKVKLFTKDLSKFLRGTINYVMSERERSETIRNDLIDVLLTFKKEAAQQTEHIAKNNDVLVAQAAIFLTAGYETSSSTMSFALYELAKRPDLQERLRQEIVEALVAEGGKLSYETINNLPYLGMVVDEVLRLYPVLPFLDRQYESKQGVPDYTLKPFHDYTLPDSMPIYIPIFGLQRDPKFWDHPETFDPQRFTPENRKLHHPMAYLPFGTGPHNCIGGRMGLLQSKLGLVHFLKNHCVTVCDKTVMEIKFDPMAFLLQNEGGMYLNITNDRLYDKQA